MVPIGDCGGASYHNGRVHLERGSPSCLAARLGGLCASCRAGSKVAVERSTRASSERKVCGGKPKNGKMVAPRPGQRACHRRCSDRVAVCVQKSNSNLVISRPESDSPGTQVGIGGWPHGRLHNYYLGLDNDWPVVTQT